MGWSFELVDMATNTSLGEIPDVKEATVTFPLKGFDSVTAAVSLYNRFADRILEARDYLFAYDDRHELMYAGPIVTAEESGGNVPRIGFTSLSPFWSLQRILVGTTAELNYTNVDRTDMLRAIITLALATKNVFIRNGAIAGVSGSYSAGPWRYKPALEGLLEVANTLDGPDFWLDYYGPGSSDGSGAKIADFNAAPFRGSDKTQTCFFEYGVGKKNVKSYSRLVSRDGLISRAYVLPSGFPQTTENVATFLDATLESVYGFGEDVIATDIGDYSLRYELGRQHVALRKQPRQTITFEAYRSDSPRFIGNGGAGDFNLGDRVTGRAAVAGKTRFDATFRVHKVTFTQDDLGIVKPEIEVIPSA